ncbi:DUF397 domain-containing protein [Actinosynnema sp. CS-041913]|uniref:DUF397 domain-containing protein n=1 Tax=Actinosynnema sp. CS-041913 TaxID=3239917 RepID=UPI003D8FBE67
MRWRKPSRSGSTSNCAEPAATTRTHAVRDSKNTAGGALSFHDPAFATFLAGISAGRFDCRAGRFDG